MDRLITRRLKAFVLTGALFAVAALPVPVAKAEELVPANRVVVRKAERKLYLYNGSQVLGSFRIALGLNPMGPKERERDYRTPEGRYFLSRRNTRSDYFLAIQVSYPNKQDEKNARRRGWAAGGSIMIHGLPNTPKHSALYYEQTDWTDGCIALSNSDMVEVWMRTQDNIPIEILP
jgi:murein L,D-transpeptidase YafK